MLDQQRLVLEDRCGGLMRQHSADKSTVPQSVQSAQPDQQAEALSSLSLSHLLLPHGSLSPPPQGAPRAMQQPSLLSRSIVHRLPRRLPAALGAAAAGAAACGGGACGGAALDKLASQWPPPQRRPIASLAAWLRCSMQCCWPGCNRSACVVQAHCCVAQLCKLPPVHP